MKLNFQMNKKLKILMIDDEGETKGLFKETHENFNALNNTILDYEIIFDTEEKFENGKKRISNYEYDIIILDLCDKDESKLNVPKSGKEILDEIKKLEFVPVIFYTGALQYLEEDLGKSDLIKIVDKTKGFQGLLEEIEKIINSIPFKIKTEINSTSKEILRDYLWEFVHEKWQEFTEIELNSLKHIIIKRFSNKLYHESLNQEQTIHPILFYQYPQINKEIFETGTILKKEEKYYVLISPSCDLAHDKITKITLLECFNLEEHVRYKELKEKLEKLKEEVITNPDKETKLIKAKDTFNNFLSSNGQTTDKEFVLPKTFFLSGFYLNFQHLKVIEFSDLKEYENIGKINSPFVEKLMNKFASNYSKVGTPDINSH